MKVTKLDLRKVQDANGHLILEILPKDIKRATLKNPGSCATARACRRQVHRESRVHLTRMYIKKNGGDIWYRYFVPNALRAEIIAFDRGGTFLPGRYILMPPNPRAKLGVRRSDKGKRTVTGNKRRKYSYIRDVRTGPASGV